ncbi:receptor-like serine/threonine-protein kinase SD1-8 [Tanacetum coccineum]
MNTDGFPEVLIWSNGTERYRSGAWNGKRLGGVPEMKSSSNTSIMEFEFLDTSDEISYSFEMLNSSVYSRLVISSSCFLKRFTWINTTQTWSMSSFAPRDQCDYYKQCGPYGICDTNYYPVCKCMKGFVPKIQQAWDLGDGSDGCVRSSKLDCGSDGFLKLQNMKLPDSSKVFVDQTMNLTTCGAICKRNCSCAAYANMDVTEGGSGCVMWEVDLIDMRQYADSEGGGQELYIRVPASDLVTNKLKEAQFVVGCPDFPARGLSPIIYDDQEDVYPKGLSQDGLQLFTPSQLIIVTIKPVPVSQAENLPILLENVMDDPNITMEEYIQLMVDKARGRDQTFNWETATYDKVYCEYIDSFTDFETEFPAIVYNDVSASNQNVSSEPTDGIDVLDSDVLYSNSYRRSCPAILGGVGRFRDISGNGRLTSTRKIKVASWNVGSLTGKLFELADCWVNSLAPTPSEFSEDQRSLHFSLCSGSTTEEQGQKKEFQFSLV